MNFNLTETLFSISFALDCVERDLLGVKTNHSKRVAYMCIEMCKIIGLPKSRLFDVAACAILHDNALTEYIHSEHKNYNSVNIKNHVNENLHCILGENNFRKLHLFEDVTGSILFHHENANGSGPFNKTFNEIPLYARLIHLADSLDSKFNLNTIDENKFKLVTKYLQENTDKLFDYQCVNWFLSAFNLDKFTNLRDENIDISLHKVLPKLKLNYSSDDLINFARIFAIIIDYKSEFTQKHSLGVADKAMKMGEYYNYDTDTRAKMYFAGAIHDIGKLVVDVDVLEKPGRLTSDEYRHIQTHVYYTYIMLKDIDGLEDIASWAYCHHEKLDGSGYPFGKTANELGKFERLFACIDIYQALTEKRPYKDGMSHNDAMKIIKDMVYKNQLDGNIANDIDKAFSPNKYSLEL